MLLRTRSDMKHTLSLHKLELSRRLNATTLNAAAERMQSGKGGWKFSALGPDYAMRTNFTVISHKAPQPLYADDTSVEATSVSLATQVLPVRRLGQRWVLSHYIQVGTRYALLRDLVQGLESCAGEFGLVEAAQVQRRPKIGTMCNELVAFPWGGYTRKKLRRMRYREIKQAWDKCYGRAWRVRVTAFAYVAVDEVNKTCYYHGHLPSVVDYLKRGDFNACTPY